MQQNKIQHSQPHHTILIFSLLTIILAVFIGPVKAEISPHKQNPKPEQSEPEKPEEPNLEKLNRQQKLEYFIQKGNDLYNRRKYAEAEAMFRQILEMKPEVAVWHYKLGNTLASQGKFDEATKAYQEAIRLNSDYALAYNGLGGLQAEQGRWEEAMKHYQRALEINPNLPDVLYNLGLALWKQGKPTEAIPHLEKAKKLFQERGQFSNARQVDKLLEELSKEAQPVS